MYRRILVAVDGSKCARTAFKGALQLAKAAGAELHVICVLEAPSGHYSPAFIEGAAVHAGMVAEARSALSAAQILMSSACVAGSTKMIDGTPDKTVAEQLQCYAQDADVDLVVLGTRGRRGLKRMVLGSVAETFVRLSTHPVLLIPHRETTSAAN
jgi:nucleotide-binding universal stress UspA family protein